jgi:hypothetical protein
MTLSSVLLPRSPYNINCLAQQQAIIIIGKGSEATMVPVEFDALEDCPDCDS